MIERSSGGSTLPSRQSLRYANGGVTPPLRLFLQPVETDVRTSLSEVLLSYDKRQEDR